MAEQAVAEPQGKEEVKIDYAKFVELGASGTQNSGGEVWNDDDYNPDLHNQSAMLVWDKMRLSDGQVAGAISHIVQPFTAATWRFSPGGDRPREGEEASKKEIEIADACTERFMHYPIVDGVSEGWTAFVRLMVTFALTHGFMLFEKVADVEPDGTFYFKKLAPRLPKSVWTFNKAANGDLKSITQWAWFSDGRYKKVDLPAKKCLLFSPFREGDNYWGRSILRAAYMHWYKKRQLLNFDAMRHERHGVGIPVMKIPANASDAAHRAALKILAELRANERQYVKIPDDWEFDIKYATGTPTDIIGSCKYHDENIGRSTLTELMSLGASISGSRSLGQNKQDILMLSLQGFGDYFCEVFTRGPMMEFVEMNFGKQEHPPRLIIEDLDTMAPLVKANVLKTLTAAKVIQPDDPLEDYARKIFYFPKRDPKSTRQSLPPGLNPFGNPTDPNDPDNPKDPVDKRPRSSGPNDKPVAGGGNGDDRVRERTNQFAEVELKQALQAIKAAQSKSQLELDSLDGVANLRPMLGRLSSDTFTVLKEEFLDSSGFSENDEKAQEGLKKVRQLADHAARTATQELVRDVYWRVMSYKSANLPIESPEKFAVVLLAARDAYADKLEGLTEIVRQYGINAGGSDSSS